MRFQLQASRTRSILRHTKHVRAYKCDSFHPYRCTCARMRIEPLDLNMTSLLVSTRWVEYVIHDFEFGLKQHRRQIKMILLSENNFSENPQTFCHFIDLFSPANVFYALILTIYVHIYTFFSL